LQNPHAGVIARIVRPSYIGRPSGRRTSGLNGETMNKFHDIPVSFHQGCPVCGRLLAIRVTLLGKRVYCQHCGGRFIAADPSTAVPPSERVQERRVADLIQRAELALQQAADDTSSESSWVDFR